MARLVWHIGNAKFLFDEESEFEQWKENPEYFFELDLDNADDRGEGIFANPASMTQNRRVTLDDGSIIKSRNGEAGPIVSAWVVVPAELKEGIGPEELTEWANEAGGWYSGTIVLGDFSASIDADDGGDWRFLDDE